MRRTVVALGIAGASLGLASAVIGSIVAASLAFRPETSLDFRPLVAAGLAFQFFVPTLALAGVTLVDEKPRTAGLVLILAGLLAPLGGSSFTSVFYLVGAGFGISEELARRRRKAALPPLDAPPGVPPGATERAILELARDAVVIGGGLAFSGCLTAVAIAFAPAADPETMAAKTLWLWPAAVAAGSSVVAASGARHVFSGRGGIFLAVVFGALGAMASATLNARMMCVGSFVGLWPALGSQAVLYGGMAAGMVRRPRTAAAASPSPPVAAASPSPPLSAAGRTRVPGPNLL